MLKARISLFLAVLAIAAGCDDTLETGYKPRRLDDNDSQRRAYYAPEFSPESHATKGNDSPPDLGMQH